METLKLRDIVCYLPYGLRWVGIRAGAELTTREKAIIEYSVSSVAFIMTQEKHDNVPILKPISDLYEPLEDGTVPIVELAKIAFPNHKWELWNNIAITKWRGLINGKFSYVQSENYFMTTLDSPVKNQIQLFDYLNEHHFDYKNLINRGLAIDINTIKL
jgi:hypothetical protein